MKLASRREFDLCIVLDDMEIAHRVPYSCVKQGENAIGRLIFLIALICGLGAPVAAQELSALARVLPEASSLSDRRGAVELRLTLSQGVPYKIFNLTAPPRIIIDFNEVDFAGLADADFDRAEPVLGFRVGALRAGWSRMVLELDQPMMVQSAGLTIIQNAEATVLIRLEPTDADSFAATAAEPASAGIAAAAFGEEPTQPLQRQTGNRPVIVVLDPGHGGIDPGAERGEAIEADLMLTFARELKEVLLRTGRFEVVLTRESDDFVPLEARVSIARRARADLFLSLHADALVDGRASGSTIYTLSEAASDLASQKLAERHDRGDLLAGVDLSDQDDVIAGVLMALARTETAPRSDKLADALVAGLSQTIVMHKRPRLSAGFSVLKAPDIPSVLLELGFLSSKRDRDRLNDDKWRAQAATGIRDGLLNWAQSDAADALLVRK